MPSLTSTVRTALAALAVTVFSLVVVSAAGAATVSVIDGTLTYTAAADETNKLTIDRPGADALRFVDTGAVISAGPGCVAVGSGTADCADSIDDPKPLKVTLRNKSDSLEMEDCCEPRTITVWAARGNDAVTIGSATGGEVTVYGGHHEDVLKTMLNNTGSSRLYGQDGRDTLIVGEGGRVFLFGGPNNDIMSYNTLLLDGTTPTDIVQVHGESGNDTFNPNPDAFHPSTIFGGDGNKDLLSATAFLEDTPFVFDMAACPTCDIERVIGSAFDDMILGDADANVIWSGDGNDTVDPRGGNDHVYAGGGDDTVEARDGLHDTIRCGAGLLDTVFADRRESIGECEIVHPDAP
jgi:Ca2+-binding RTX toxin-like protein